MDEEWAMLNFKNFWNSVYDDNCMNLARENIYLSIEIDYDFFLLIKFY